MEQIWSWAQRTAEKFKAGEVQICSKGLVSGLRVILSNLIYSPEWDRASRYKMSSYLRSVLCKDPNKLLRVRSAAFGQQPGAEDLRPLGHLRRRRRSVNKEQRAAEDDWRRKCWSVSDLGVGDPLVGLPRLPEAKTRAVSWGTPDSWVRSVQAYF